MKYGLQKAGMRKVCRHCGSTDLTHGSEKSSCNACKRQDVPLEMHFTEIKGYKRHLEELRSLSRWSLRRCEELHALWFLAVALALLLAFIWIV
jgi:hypothetical protein